MQETSNRILTIIGERVVKHLQTKDKSQFKYPSLESIKAQLRVQGIDATSIINALYYLRRRKYIKHTRQNHTTTIVLTAKGAIQYVKFCPLLLPSTHKKGCQSMVIIRVSEKNRSTRDFLRRRLLQAGFSHQGQGIYVSPRKISANLDLLVKLFALEVQLLAGEFCRW